MNNASVFLIVVDEGENHYTAVTAICIAMTVLAIVVEVWRYSPSAVARSTTVEPIDRAA